MKTVVGIVTLCVAIVLTGAALSEKQQNRFEAKDVYVYAKTDEYTYVKEAEAAAELIVEGEKLSSQPSIIVRNTRGDVVLAYTLSRFKIDKTFKGNVKQKIITILENTGYDEKANVNYHINGYTLMKDGDRYRLLLTRAEDGSGRYISVGVNAGKIPL